jgi:hypothetical protein
LKTADDTDAISYFIDAAMMLKMILRFLFRQLILFYFDSFFQPAFAFTPMP